MVLKFRAGGLLRPTLLAAASGLLLLLSFPRFELSFLAWVALGFAGSGLMVYAERTRTRWLPPLAGLLALVPLVLLDIYVRNAQLERLHLWLGGLTGILAMGAFLAWRHPGAVRREAGER